MNEIQVKNVILEQIQKYLKGEISKETYADMAEDFFCENVDHIENTEFEKIFRSIIPDACLDHVDDPLPDSVLNEKIFKKKMNAAYEKLIKL